MRVDIEFSSIEDVLAPAREVLGKFGTVNRVTFDDYSSIRTMLRQLAKANLDGNMRVFLAGTDERVDYEAR